MALDKTFYKTSVIATGGRDGRALSMDGNLDVKLARPQEIGGSGTAGAAATNPEQLFAAGYSACFLNAVRHAAAQRKLALPQEAAVKATVSLGPKGQAFALDVELSVSLPGIEKDVAEALVLKAHELCPYSNATRGNIDVQLSIA